MGKWYYCKNGQQLGPIGLGELTSFIERGELSADDRVWKVGTPEWLRIYRHQELLDVVPGVLKSSPRPQKIPAKPRSIIASILVSIGKQR